MVGGMVTDVLPLNKECLWINTRERVWNPHTGWRLTSQSCAVTIERSPQSERIQPGDSLWWQGNQVFWTPEAVRALPEDTLKCGQDYDIPFAKIGYSGVAHPAQKLIDSAYPTESV